jgi:hypothetical protein
MILKRLFFVLMILCASDVYAGEVSVVERSIVFPTTSSGAIAPKIIVSTENDPEKKEGYLLLTTMILINSGEANVIGLDMTMTDGFVSGIVLHLVKEKGDGNRIRMFFLTKRYPSGLLDTPFRLAKWTTLAQNERLATCVIPDTEDENQVLVGLIFYRESTEKEGLISPELVQVAREALDGS